MTLKVHTDSIDGIVIQIGYRVVTTDMKSLGLRKNPHILTYPLDEWLTLPEDQLEEGNGDWGGIWVCRTPGGAKALMKYMAKQHDQETLAFKAAIDRVLYVNSYRLKTNAVMLYESLPF